MNRMRKMLCFLMAMTFAAFALPGFAATKQFNVSLSSITGGSTTATFNNLSTGNSVIKSESLTVPSGFTITSASAQAPFTGVITPTCTTNAPCTTIQVNFQSGIPAGTSAALNLTVTVPATAACSQATWTTAAFTGNNLGGTQFSYTGALPTTTNLSGCLLMFQTQPTNAQINTAITPQVQVAVVNASNSVQTWFTGAVTLTNAGPGTGTVAGGAANAVSGVASFPSLAINAAGQYKLNAGASGFVSVASNQFTIFAGILACGAPIEAKFIDPANLAPDQPGYASGTRNTYNKDGVSEQCKNVLYTFTNTIMTNETVNLTWDTGLQPNAAFEYTLNWQAQPVEAGDKVSGWPMELRPVVAWLNLDGSQTTGLSPNPVFVPGLACLGNSLPMPYGTLVNAVDDQPGSTSITVTRIASNPSIINPLTGTAYTQPVPGDPAIPAYPFPIVIADMVGGVQGTATERMLVTNDTARSSSAGIWTMTFTVQRGDGMTTLAAHDTAYRVMSTPLPLIPTDDPTNYPTTGVYAPGTQAHMCIAAHGFTSFDFSGGTAHLLYKTHVFDIGDGWVGLR